MENKQALSVVKRRSEKIDEAIAVKNYSMLKQEGEVVWYELNLEEQIRYLKSLLEQEKFHGHKVVDDCGAVGSDKHEGNNNVVDDEDDSNGKSFPEASQSDLERMIVEADSLPDSCTIDMVKLVTVVDTGGQPEYIHLLPAINSYPTITFIVHDLNEKLHENVNVYREVNGKKVKERSLNFSYLDMIHLLMCFVSDTSEQQPPKQAVPYVSVPEKSFIGFVATHYDEVKDNPTVIENINDKLKEVIIERKFKSEGVLSSQVGIIHPVNNKTAGDGEKEDLEAKQIRKQIEQLANKVQPRTLPITWMILQLRLQQLRANDQRGYITYEEYTKVAKEFLNDDNEVKASLIYFHFAGLVLYFEDPSLC